MFLKTCHPESVTRLRPRRMKRWVPLAACLPVGIGEEGTGRQAASGTPNQHQVLRAFSIVELLVVLAIVAILASIFIPYLATVRESERRVRCADNLRLVMQALHNYASL